MVALSRGNYSSRNWKTSVSMCDPMLPGAITLAHSSSCHCTEKLPHTRPLHREATTHQTIAQRSYHTPDHCTEKLPHTRPLHREATTHQTIAQRSYHTPDHCTEKLPHTRPLHREATTHHQCPTMNGYGRY